MQIHKCRAQWIFKNGKQAYNKEPRSGNRTFCKLNSRKSAPLTYKTLSCQQINTEFLSTLNQQKKPFSGPRMGHGHPCSKCLSLFWYFRLSSLFSNSLILNENLFTIVFLVAAIGIVDLPWAITFYLVWYTLSSFSLKISNYNLLFCNTK